MALYLPWWRKRAIIRRFRILLPDVFYINGGAREIEAKPEVHEVPFGDEVVGEDPAPAPPPAVEEQPAPAPQEPVVEQDPAPAEPAPAEPAPVEPAPEVSSAEGAPAE